MVKLVQGWDIHLNSVPPLVSERPIAQSRVYLLNSCTSYTSPDSMLGRVRSYTAPMAQIIRIVRADREAAVTTVGVPLMLLFKANSIRNYFQNIWTCIYSSIVCLYHGALANWQFVFNPNLDAIWYNFKLSMISLKLSKHFTNNHTQ